MIEFINDNREEYFKIMKLIVIACLIISFVFATIGYLINPVITWEVVAIRVISCILGIFFSSVFTVSAMKNNGTI